MQIVCWVLGVRLEALGRLCLSDMSPCVLSFGLSLCIWSSSGVAQAGLHVPGTHQHSKFLSQNGQMLSDTPVPAPSPHTHSGLRHRPAQSSLATDAAIATCHRLLKSPLPRALARLYFSLHLEEATGVTVIYIGFSGFDNSSGLWAPGDGVGGVRRAQICSQKRSWWKT